MTAAVRWNSLQRLKFGRIVILGADALLLVAVIAGASVHRYAMKTVGKDTAPSIIAAQHIKSALADMDADAVNELLGAPIAMATADKAYEARRVEASKALIEAAKNITYGDAEQKPIETLQVGIGTYERLIQQARDLHQSGSPAVVAAYRDAAAVMDRTLLPAADALDAANNNESEKTYEGKSADSLLARWLVGFAGLLALGALGWTQLYITRLTRRMINPLLLAATFVTLAVTGFALLAMSSEQRHLKVAKEDSFASLHALWRARAVSYQANSDESRYLLDPAHAGEDQAAFFAKSDSLVRLPASVDLHSLLAREANGVKVEGFSGYLADELNNITFPGEREAAVTSLATWERYLAIDAAMRKLERDGQHAQAVALCLGASEGQSDWAFEQFDKALLATLDINQAAFDDAVAKGFAALNLLEIEAAVAAAAAAVLVFMGCAARIREYE